MTRELIQYAPDVIAWLVVLGFMAMVGIAWTAVERLVDQATKWVRAWFKR